MTAPAPRLMLPAAPQLADLPPRLRDQIKVVTPGHWVWTGYVHPKGYGQAIWRGIKRSAAVVIHESLIGPVAPDRKIDQLCSVQLCVFPLCGELVTRGEHQRRAFAKARRPEPHPRQCKPRAITKADITEKEGCDMTTLDWQARAACRDHDPELFFPVSEIGPGARQVERAKAVCAGCPVRLDCLIGAFERGDEWAVLGGTTPTERRALRAAPDPAAAIARVMRARSA